MNRAPLAILSCAGALVVGVYTACLSARNRARGGELDEKQHGCETFSRQNELLRAANDEEEWRLLHEEEDEADSETAVIAGLGGLGGIRGPEH